GLQSQTVLDATLVPAGPLDGADSNGLQVGVQLPGGVQTGPQQQNQQLLLTPASLQLAQLQAQLTLHRLKLAQGGNTAAAASVLSQVLSNVNMSQPLFNQLRTSPAVGNPQGAFPSGVLGFPSSGSALGALMGGGFNQNPGNVRLNQPCGGSMGQQGGEYAKKSGSAYPSDTDRRLQYNLAGGAAAAPTAGDGQYPAINTPANNMNSVSFQRDFYGQEMQGQPGGFGISEQKVSVYNSAGHKEQWKGHANLTHAGKVDLVSNPAAVWTAAGQPLRSRTDLYNPEEPTSDPKLSCGGGVSSFVSSGAQGFGGYPPLHGSEEILSSGTRTLQPYQVNDFHAVTPAQLPHQCSICDKKVYNLKDWDQHVKGKLHLQNRTLYSNESLTSFVRTNTKMPPEVCFTCSVDLYPGSFYIKQLLLKDCAPLYCPQSFPPRKATVGRVVHICNLPEGSCTENDVINLGLPFGKVTNYILMRSTHQAFLEMAYVEAAQAMVQYYQLTPAVINNQKLLIRMSKRYKELQLKKPGKDVQSIIQDITSQRERDEMQELEPYVPERARSRSPISRSLSPHSHSPSFTSCSSRGSNGMGPHRASWDWPSHRRGEEERERDRDDPWRNGSGADDERPNGRASERRKTYQKPSDHLGSRSADERGGGGGDGMRSGRDWHPRSSPQSSSFNSYRNMEDDFFMEHVYKSDKPLRPSYQRHEAKSKRRDGGDYHARSRHSDFEMSEESLCKASEDKRQSSPGRARGKKTSRRHATPERHERNAAESSVSRRLVTSTPILEWESGDETDEDVWYPNNMEELVTVDEVGGEDDSIIEPDLSELEEFASGPKEPAAEEPGEARVSPSVPSAEVKEECDEKSQAERSLNAFPVLISGLYLNVIGVEFIVPRTGFFCKLCGLFYTSEEAAKTSHCRSTVHYRNLQVQAACGSHRKPSSGFSLSFSLHVVTSMSVCHPTFDPA
uniref:RNA binding motif protein 20 n=1 Tax=Salarias fasciatus TaxID=181472 RepID=A0A672HC32_SALFA